MRKTKVIIPLIGIIGLMLLIFYFSSLNGVESHRLSKGIVRFFRDMSPAIKGFKEHGPGRNIEFDFLLRKFLHFSEFFLLSLLVFAAASGLGTGVKRAQRIAVVICFLYSVSDEVHQIFISGRTPRAADVLIDTCGSIVAMALAGYILKKRRMGGKPEIIK